jgi:hypothetical protein
MSYADESYQSIMGLLPTRPAAQRAPEERRAALEKFFSIVDTLSDAELADNPLAGRPLNVSVLDEDRPTAAHAA